MTEFEPIVKERILEDYRRGDRLEEIAIRYNTTAASVSVWAERAHIPRRKQGSRHRTRPSPKDMAVIEAVNAAKSNPEGGASYEEIGAAFGCTRANVSRIYRRWAAWVPDIPFKKGDVIRFLLTDYEVITPGVFTGTVRNRITGKTETISWERTVGAGKQRSMVRAVLLASNGGH